MQTKISTGTVEGTGALLAIACGFPPKYFRAWNIDASSPIAIEWFDSMGDDKCLTLIDTGAGAVDMAYSSTTGVTATAKGMELSSDCAVNIDGETIHYLVLG